MKYLELIEEYKEDIIKSTQEIIRIKSIEEKPLPGMPFGKGPYDALVCALDLGAEMGFETKNMEGYAGWIEFGQGEETLGILAHVDVVPEGTGWTYPPYGAEIHDNKIWGRGTLDDKGPAIAALYAMKAIKDSGLNLNKKVRMILGANEETGWGCMDYYFKNEKAPDLGFTPDADFPVIYGEKGIIIFDLVTDFESKPYKGIEVKELMGGNAPNMVPDNARVLLNVEDTGEIKASFDKFMDLNDYPLDLKIDGNSVEITAGGISAHGSTPEVGKSAITYLMAFLGEIFQGQDNFSNFIGLYNERIAFQHYGEKIGCGLSDDISGKLNFNPGVLSLVDDKIILKVNVRYPIKSSARQVYDGIHENLKGTCMYLIEGQGETLPLYVDKDSFLVSKLMDIYREETGDSLAEPLTIGGGTYARAMKNAVAFGPMFPGQEALAHQKDEFIDIDHLMQLTRIYGKAIYELAK